MHQVNKLTHGLLDGKPWFVFALLVVCINLSLLYIIEVNDTWCVLLQVPNLLKHIIVWPRLSVDFIYPIWAKKPRQGPYMC